MPSLTGSPAWQALIAHHAGIKDVHLRTLFADDPGRAERLSAEGAGLFLDFEEPHHRRDGAAPAGAGQ